jgi:hypothetical protein
MKPASNLYCLKSSALRDWGKQTLKTTIILGKSNTVLYQYYANITRVKKKRLKLKYLNIYLISIRLLCEGDG